MEGSAAAAPAAADGGGQVQAPAQPAAPAQAPANPAAPGTEQAVSPEDQFSQRLQEMEQRAQAAEQQLQQLQGEQGEGEPGDLLAALQGNPEDFGLSAEELAAAQAGEDPNQVAPDQQEAQLEEFNQFLDQRIQEALTPLQEERWAEGIESWKNAHPDVKPKSELFNEIVSTADRIVGNFGGEGRVTPDVLDVIYSAAKAKLADAGAVPAEQAGADGATLETGPGQTQVGEDSEADQYRKELLSSAGNNPFA